MNNLLLVAAGGAVGASLRHLVNAGSARLTTTAFPWWTIVINILGSLIMGLLVGWLARRSGTSDALRLFVATGMLGGFTTFSAFSLDFATLWQRGEVMGAFGYVAASVIVSLIAVFAGLWVARILP
ncbi:fluoride efflux transporter CrcB [Tianweitania sp. BSSL-BM11]|uniref:Fluoride-specific ion channel FluC n=1 Tax=Tianweitania aestuarii TaxID=2814886 RepID=A0ABS5RVT4_9HYPH|nr:fluoride efflux transporter CrcB [Tianweitania aestuarii]MBS9720376.1 fluoride efflux transporter CrcB [Tianweitania aestuarii]